MKKVILVFGTRPEAIKMCPLVIELRNRPDVFDVIVCVTGQHKEMLSQVLGRFGIVPEYDLDIMKPNQDLFDITCNVLQGIRDVLQSEDPDLVLVHGDTTTSFAAALACFYSGVEIGHVEAGLRTGNMYSPWPEEFNRQAIDLVTRYYFAPTAKSEQNLLAEGKNPSKVFVTGNTGIDALRYTIDSNYESELLRWAAGSKLILITAHRRENLGDPMRHMFRAIKRVVDENEDVKAVYPMHMNPAIRQIAQEELGDTERIRIVEPLDVFDFHNTMAASYLILTDSGGIQEEAPSLGKPVLVMRDTTERPEGIASGTLRMVGTDEASIYQAFTMLINNKSEYQKMATASNPYGDGYSSARIAEIISNR